MFQREQIERFSQEDIAAMASMLMEINMSVNRFENHPECGLLFTEGSGYVAILTNERRARLVEISDMIGRNCLGIGDMIVANYDEFDPDNYPVPDNYHTGG